jgi:hypothetical protein
MSLRPSDASALATASSPSLLTALGVVYVHEKTSDGGDLYLTRFGREWSEHLQVENWYENDWFSRHKEPLRGTSAVYRVPTRLVNGVQLDLVVKNCRVGEDVPVETRALLAELNSEFNSPWEEFALVMELRQGRFGPEKLRIRTQEPLAIYMPPEVMQLWQTGRSRYKINRIRARHRGIELDILKQYKLIYRWIDGQDVVSLSQSLGFAGARLEQEMTLITQRVTEDLANKGYVVADMKPAHVIIDHVDLPGPEAVGAMADPRDRDDVDDRPWIRAFVEDGNYSMVDYELLARTPEHEEQVKQERRHRYLDDQKVRFEMTERPSHLEAVEIMGVPYIHGRVESTGGQLWVVGRNARLYDYFLPERWRKTPAWRLSHRNDLYYTLTKDRIHLVWKVSRVGERPNDPDGSERSLAKLEQGYHSPFEEFSIAHRLSQHGVPAVYVRAIYMTGTSKLEASTDRRRYASHTDLRASDGRQLLREDRNYITLRGFYNGPDGNVSAHVGDLRWPLRLSDVVARNLVPSEEATGCVSRIRAAIQDLGLDAEWLDADDLLVDMQNPTEPTRDAQGMLDVRVSNFEWIRFGREGPA